MSKPEVIQVKIGKKKRKGSALSKEDAVSALEELKGSLGWQIIIKALDENIADVDTQMENPELRTKTPNEYMTQMAALLAKKTDRKALKNLPDNIISDLNDAEAVRPELDPYS